MRWFAGVLAIVVVVVLSGCAHGEPSALPDVVQFTDFQTALDEGANCATLVELKNRLDPDLQDRANQKLRDVSCYSATSERQESGETDVSAGPWKNVPGQRVVPSAACRGAMETAADEKDPTRATPLITASLDACKTSDEWLSALEIEPGVMGMVDGFTPDLQTLQVACHSAKTAAVCVDAATNGIEIP